MKNIRINIAREYQLDRTSAQMVVSIKIKRLCERLVIFLGCVCLCSNHYCGQIFFFETSKIVFFVAFVFIFY